MEITKKVVKKIVDVYLSHRYLPRSDALHLACASNEEMDSLVIWNLRYIYKRGTQEMIHEVN